MAIQLGPAVELIRVFEAIAVRQTFGVTSGSETESGLSCCSNGSIGQIGNLCVVCTGRCTTVFGNVTDLLCPSRLSEGEEGLKDEDRGFLHKIFMNSKI